MAEQDSDKRSIVERWFDDQREWQRTVLAYMDSMVKDDDFLVHLGNAMRGSLLAGKPYPGVAVGPNAEGQAATPSADAAAEDGRLDEILFALHRIEGQLNDLRMTVDGLQRGASAHSPAPPVQGKLTSEGRNPARAAGKKPAAATTKKPSTKKPSKKKNMRSKTKVKSKRSRGAKTDLGG